MGRVVLPNEALQRTRWRGPLNLVVRAFEGVVMGGESGPRVPASDWFDLWHWHPAFERDGLPGSDESRGRLRSLFAAWSRVEGAAAWLTRPSQTWLVIDSSDPGQDAVYLHTANPNRDNFPYAFEGVTWGIEPPDELTEFMAGSGLEVGCSECEGSVLYWVRRRNGVA